jgi:hypothetical protein
VAKIPSSAKVSMFMSDFVVRLNDGKVERCNPKEITLGYNIATSTYIID